MQVRKRNEDFKSENEFLTDCMNSVSAFLKRFKYGWPRRDKLAKELGVHHGVLLVYCVQYCWCVAGVILMSSSAGLRRQTYRGIR